jgi:hypothetical protein
MVVVIEGLELFHRPEKKRDWRDDESKNESKRKRSHGVTPTSFHSSLQNDSNAELLLDRTLCEADSRVKRSSFKSKYEDFEQMTTFKEWPLQDLALKNLDELLEFDKEKNGTSDDSLLWSQEPRIFALEKSGQGKRRYVVAHLGRFVHHYFRQCDASARHYYELIREGTPCRLYFGKTYPIINKHIFIVVVL